jgi:phosphatidylserine decarboxylase
MPTTSLQKWSLPALRVLPKNALSRLAGRIAGLRLPGPLQRAQIRAFGSLFGVEFDEVRDPIERFDSLQEFFTRALKPDARPIDPDPRALTAPCDGAWGEAGRIEDGTLLQVKGKSYRLEALVASAEEAKRFDGGSYATFYLSPRDYHRFHTPCALRVERAQYLPGTLWPVNRAGVEGIQALYAENERICAYMRPDALTGAGQADALVCMVAVGATLVGKVRVDFDELSTNVKDGRALRRDYGERGRRYRKGEEWGRFEFGSTIVLLATPGLVELDVSPAGTGLRLGARIGTLFPDWRV